MSVVTALSVTCTPIYAYSEKAISDEQYVMLQANRLMNSVNMDTLKEATENSIIDYSIPASIRDGIGANAEFIPVSGTSEDTLTMDVNSTVRKIGEVKNKAGKASNMYVTASVVSATVKETGIQNSSMISKHGLLYIGSIIWVRTTNLLPQQLHGKQEMLLLTAAP